MISFNNVTRYYGSKRALHDVSFSIQKGESVGILGPNGSGKTTLINILLGLLRADMGTVTVGGLEVWANRAILLPKVGSIIEIPRLYPDLSGRDNLKIFARFLGIDKIEQKLDEVLDWVGLGSVGVLKFRNYSLGMKQRLGIALSLLNEPEILVFDEPTNGLDPEGIITVREILKKLSQSGKTILLCSHLIHEVEQVCNSVIILQNGVVRKNLSSRELESRENLFHVTVESGSDFEGLVRLLQSRKFGEIVELVPDRKTLKFRLDGGSGLPPASVLKNLISESIGVESFYKEQIPLEELFLEAVKS